MPEMHLRQPDLRTKLVEHLLKTKKEFKKIKKQDSKYLSKRTRCSFFFLSALSFMNIHDSQDTRGSRRLFL